MQGGQVTIRMLVRQINKESFLAAMGKGEYPLYKHQPIVRAFSRYGRLYVVIKSGLEIRCGLDEVTVSW